MASGKHTFQAPKGTRDFYPADMAVRRHLEKVWREVSINHGFEEIDGPTFEHLDLYTAKSGPGIVSELFSFERAGGDTKYALRPEFTPTLARMVAARAAQLPKPIKWFCMPNFFRAERPQRGRLREFQQWNADILGDDSPRADAEVIAVTIGLLERIGLTAKDARVHVSNRPYAEGVLRLAGIMKESIPAWFDLLDRSSKISDDDYLEHAVGLGSTIELARRVQQAFQLSTSQVLSGLKELFPRADTSHDNEEFAKAFEELEKSFDRFARIASMLEESGRGDWIEWNPRIVRGLAYYTGTVFEVHETSGKERAIAGGGRYDKLVELFGGPPTPAVGIAMGDVVLSLVLQDKGLLKPAEEYLPRPDVFVIAADDAAAAELPKLVATLRREGLHVRQSSRSTRNVGKLLGDANKCRARFAIILGKELADGVVALKNLETGAQRDIKRDDIVSELRSPNA